MNGVKEMIRKRDRLEAEIERLKGFMEFMQNYPNEFPARVCIFTKDKTASLLRIGGFIDEEFAKMLTQKALTEAQREIERIDSHFARMTTEYNEEVAA